MPRAWTKLLRHNRPAVANLLDLTYTSNREEDKEDCGVYGSAKDTERKVCEFTLIYWIVMVIVYIMWYICEYIQIVHGNKIIVNQMDIYTSFLFFFSLSRLYTWLKCPVNRINQFRKISTFFKFLLCPLQQPQNFWQL